MRPILPSTLMHRCFGRARGWNTVVYRWGQDGGFPRLGWWAISTDYPPFYLGSDHMVVLTKFANNPARTR